MIISKTPLRISFAGGLTDLPEFYKKDYGAVTSTTINKHIYVTVNKKFTGKSRIAYQKYEEVDSFDEISHPIIKECLKFLKIEDRIEITTIADIPGGTGLGSSSAFTVGLLKALHRFKGEDINPQQLAEEACHIEMDILKEPIGKQDQYISSFGNLNHIIFREDSVEVKPIFMDEQRLKRFESKIGLYYTNLQRNASDLLKKQKKQIEENYNDLLHLRIIAEDMYYLLRNNNNNINNNMFGDSLHRAWLLKKKMKGVSNEFIDKVYETARARGVIGGKILGAGGGGFMMFYSDKIWNIKPEMTKLGLKRMNFKFEKKGSEIIYDNEDE